MNDGCEFCPDFIVAGTQKGGTTSAISYLNQHKDIHMAKEELHFFWDHNKYKKGMDFYERQFEIPQGDNKLLVGEKSPDYCALGYALDRIKDACPGVKLILFLRNPIERAYSAWNMHITSPSRFETRTFREAITEDVQWGCPIKTAKSNGTYYVRRGYYSNQIEYICKKFGRQNLHIIISERCCEKSSLIKQYNGIFNFLGVSEISDDKFKTNRNTHVGHYEKSISKEDYDYLYKIYEPYNKRAWYPYSFQYL
jgi:hypothetical protein